MNITVKPSSDSIQFNLPCPDSSEWQVNAVVGNTAGASGTRADHLGNRERLVYMSYNGKQKGYLELTKCGYIKIEAYGHALLGDPSTNTPPIPPLATICQLIKAADKAVAESEVGHLYLLPFPISGKVVMGSHRVTV